MNDFIKRLSIGALKTAFRHYKDDTIGKIRKNLANSYESFADKIAVIFRRLWLAILISSFCSSGVVIAFMGIFMILLPFVLNEEIVNMAGARTFGVIFLVLGSVIAIFPLVVILGLTRKETVHEMLEVDEVRKKLTNE